MCVTACPRQEWFCKHTCTQTKLKAFRQHAEKSKASKDPECDVYPECDVLPTLALPTLKHARRKRRPSRFVSTATMRKASKSRRVYM